MENIDISVALRRASKYVAALLLLLELEYLEVYGLASIGES